MSKITTMKVDQMIAESRPPTCLHILGQGLVNRLWAEGNNMRDMAMAVLVAFDYGVPSLTKGQVDALVNLKNAVHGAAILTTDEERQVQSLSTETVGGDK